MGLLSLLGTIGRGITGGLDDMAYNTAGGPLLGSILNSTAPPPQLPQAGGLLATMQPMTSTPPPDQGMTSALAPWADAQRMPPMQAQQAQPQGAWQPDPATKKMMRGMFLGALSNTLAQRGAALRGLSVGGGDPMDDYRTSIQRLLLTQRAAQQAAVQQTAQRQAQAGFSQDMQMAGNDPEMQRQALNKWGPYVGADMLKAYGDIAKDYRKPANELHSILKLPGAGPGGQDINLPFMKDGTTGVPILSQPIEKFQNLEGTKDVATPDGLGQPKKFIRDDGTTFMGMLDYKNHQVVDAATRKPVDGQFAEAPSATKPEPFNSDRVYMISAGGNPDDPKTWTPDVVKKFALLKKPEKETTPAEQMAALDREVNLFGSPYQRAVDQSADQLAQLREARNLITGPAAVQPMGIIKTLSSIAAGRSSGVRITSPELASVAQGRGIQGDVEGWLNKISGQGSLSGEQVRQISGLLDGIADLVQKKTAILNSGLDAIKGSGSRDEMVAAEKQLRAQLYGAAPASASSDVLPDRAAAQLKEGVNTPFKNGQIWTKRNGIPVRVK